VYNARQFWHHHDSEDVKREVICNKEEERKRQEQARHCSAYLLSASQGFGTRNEQSAESKTMIYVTEF